jgi:hypothetical protein
LWLIHVNKWFDASTDVIGHSSSKDDSSGHSFTWSTSELLLLKKCMLTFIDSSFWSQMWLGGCWFGYDKYGKSFLMRKFMFVVLDLLFSFPKQTLYLYMFTFLEWRMLYRFKTLTAFLKPNWYSDLGLLLLYQFQQSTFVDNKC